MPAKAKATAADGEGGAATNGSAAGGRTLVIVESPAKAKTIQGYLGPGYEVEASVGHIRDLPKRAADIPPKYKGASWSRLGVDVDNGYSALYVVDADKKTKVAELKKKLAESDTLLLATDEDREGEAIAWHLLEVLSPKVPVRRMVFHEITKDAIQRAVNETRDLDQDLVDAQETRRILDRLYGYEVSPVLWKKVMTGLSAGRVQSVATRLVVDRERERIAFRSASYWDIEGLFDPGAFNARLVAVDGRRVATGKDFDDRGTLQRADAAHLTEESATSLAASLADIPFTVRSVEDKPYRRSPAAPFMTSTLQQEASRKLRWGAQRTMRVAQGLYERGFITYMRTDSTTLSESAVSAARAQAAQLYGSDHVAEVPRRYDRKVKNAQEAHEAVRPAGDRFRTPAEVAGELRGDDFALYDLIWKRTVASQMADARGMTATIRLGAVARDGRDAEFSVSGTVITFRGFLAAYEESVDDDADRGDDAERRLPPLAVGDTVTAVRLDPEGHATNPPARYTEASLVKALEERGIGRPSTYASIMGTIVDRGYVVKRGSALVPSFLAFAVVRLMEEHFSTLVDYDFTARLEEVLDTVASGQLDRVGVLDRFYRGDPERDFAGLHPLVNDLGEIDARQISSFPIEGSDAVLRVGRYGAYVERGDHRANVPADLAPDELTAEKADELLSAPSGDHPLGVDPDTGLEVVAKTGRYGPYVTEVLPEGAPKSAKPRTASLFSDMAIDTIDLATALRLLSLPREVGVDPADGVVITAQNGRYGPYLTKDKDSRSLPSEDAIFTVTLDEALALFAQPKQRRGQAAPKPGVVVGVDPSTGREVQLKEGRFGPYVTDGETNASLRRADDPETISIERASDLLAERRAKEPAPKKRAAGKTAAKRTTKKAPAKKAAKKAPAKKAASKPTGAATMTAESGDPSSSGS
ncbi:MAG: type I DNA topoisomerase [Frankiales bacterium]|nr:type I DNA topoisomerase [Frankiales bacterium]